jgi:hypothetical protein
MTRWEYAVWVAVDPDTKCSDWQDLERRGREGWEAVCSYIDNDGDTVVLLKRPTSLPDSAGVL